MSSKEEAILLETDDTSNFNVRLILVISEIVNFCFKGVSCWVAFDFYNTVVFTVTVDVLRLNNSIHHFVHPNMVNKSIIFVCSATSQKVL